MPNERAHGIQLAKMCEAFIEHGADVELIVPDKKEAQKLSLRSFYNLRVDIPVTRIAVSRMTSPRLDFLVSAATFGMEHFFYLRRKRRKGEQAALYTIDLDNFSFLLIPFLGMPYVVEIHDAKPKGMLYRMLFRRARGIIAINHLIRKKLIERFGIAEEKIIVHPNGIDTTPFQNLASEESARAALDIPFRLYIAAYVGRFYPWKGLGVLLKAAELLEKEIAIYLVGGDYDELLRLSGHAAIPQGLLCVGHRDFKEIPNWLAAADCVILLGTRENEYSFLHTSPMKLFEYMASGKPIIASRTPANEEIVSSDDVFFYEPDNARELAAKIQYVRSHPAEAREKARRARAKVEGYTWAKRAGSILHFIEQRVGK